MNEEIKKIKKGIKLCEKTIKETKLTKSKALNIDVIKTLKAMCYEKIKDILIRKE